jgi:hypothetical protein
MPRKAQGAKGAYPGAKAKPAKARKPKTAPKAQTKKPKALAAADGLAQPEIREEAKGEVEAIIKRYRGRPTKYAPWMCDAVIAWGRLGKSKTWMAAEMMVHTETLSNWAAENPDFFDALKIAKALEQQHWEDLGHDNARATGFQGAMWSRSMAARFPKDWRESKQVDHGLSDGLAELMGFLDGNSAELV